LKNKIYLIVILATTLFALSPLEKGDEQFIMKNYKNAIASYLKSPNSNTMEVKLRLIQCYIRLGDNYYKIKNYDIALDWYEKSRKLKSRTSLSKIALVYEKKADEYNKINDYKSALSYYQKALNLKNKNVLEKIEKINKLLLHQSKLTKDTRIIVNQNSPSWTHTIGRLIIPTKLTILKNRTYQMKNKKCSATLVNLKENQNSNVIITASHCISSYNKKAGQLKFIIKDSSGNMLYRVAKIELDSNFNIKQMNTKTDFAILSLIKPISSQDIKPFIVQKESFITLQKNNKNNFGSLGGFSSDIAKYGANLTYDPKCKLKKYTKMYAASTCKGFHGASGGPIVLTTNTNNNSQYHFVGVVSHFKNKDFTNIYFAPHHLIFDKLKNIINSF
jgi:tetratricopeptide (TPR) repeat protein